MHSHTTHSTLPLQICRHTHIEDYLHIIYYLIIRFILFEYLVIVSSAHLLDGVGLLIEIVRVQVPGASPARSVDLWTTKLFPPKF